MLQFGFDHPSRVVAASRGLSVSIRHLYACSHRCALRLSRVDASALELHYDPAQFAAGDVDRLAERFVVLLERIALNPGGVPGLLRCHPPGRAPAVAVGFQSKADSIRCRADGRPHGGRAGTTVTRRVSRVVRRPRADVRRIEQPRQSVGSRAACSRRRSGSARRLVCRSVRRRLRRASGDLEGGGRLRATRPGVSARAFALHPDRRPAGTAADVVDPGRQPAAVRAPGDVPGFDDAGGGRARPGCRFQTRGRRIGWPTSCTRLARPARPRA